MLCRSGAFSEKVISQLICFAINRRGNIAIMFSLLAVPVMLSLGLAIDYSNASLKRSNLQNVADAAVVAAAASEATTKSGLLAVVEKHLAGHNARQDFEAFSIDSFDLDGATLKLKLSADSETSFMRLANINTVRVAVDSAATRGSGNTVEIALVMDNTWSMSETDNRGVQKIQALKEAASDLVDSVMSARVTVSLIPYSQVVNVNKATTPRTSPWLEVPKDRYVGGSCYQRSSGVTCKKSEPMPCYRDGVADSTACRCLEYDTSKEVVEEYCANGYAETWHGCVGMRYDPAVRTNDGDPSVKYPGYVERYTTCLSPIMPLGTGKSQLKTAINAMAINSGSYRPETYIPLGLMWGLHTLSPEAPYAEGKDYSIDNKVPRKVIVLMSDGFNTLALKSDGYPTNPIYMTYNTKEQ